MTDRTPPEDNPKQKASFRTFFFRGLGILLPTILTIWILVAVFNFMYVKIAEPINRGLREAILLSPWPALEENEVVAIEVSELTDEERESRKLAASTVDWDRKHLRRNKLERLWNTARIAGYPVLDVIGLFIAAILVYMTGLILGSFFGRRILKRLGTLVRRIPVVKQVYPYVKQVTDFLFASEGKEKIKFNRVVAVEYPRKGLWSVGLVTGDTMQAIQDRAGVSCVTVFVPSSPTPFTGYVITVPATDTIELDVTIDEALRFTVSGGVLVPDSQVIGGPVDPDAAALPPDAAEQGAGPENR